MKNETITTSQNKGHIIINGIIISDTAQDEHPFGSYPNVSADVNDSPKVAINPKI